MSGTPLHLLPTSEYTGPLNSGFLYADGLSFSGVDSEAQQCAGLALSAARRNSLVKGSKSPTRDIQAAAVAHNLFDNRSSRDNGELAPLAFSVDGPFSYLSDKGRREQQQIETDAFEVARSVDGAGSSTVIEYREWCEEYRIRTRVNGQMNIAPPVNSGARESVMLSSGGARKIAESCEYMARKKGGFKTFVTGTFDDEARARIRAGETSVQKEVTRTVDAMVKMYQRGWEYEEAGEKIKVAGYSKGLVKDKFRYCWVVEIPKNEAGEDNPHIHLLMDWRVDYKHFRAWSARIEKLWSNGYWNLQHIKDAGAAGAYMAKAAGYITKGAGQNDQGRVVGNRYAISADARAPAWLTINVMELGIMGRLIRETYDHIQHKHKQAFYQRKVLNEKRDDIVRRANVAKKASPDNKQPEAARVLRKRIGAKLMAVRKKINAMPIRASKYQLVIKDHYVFNQFIQRAERVGWGAAAPPSTAWIYQQKRRREAWTDSELSAFSERSDEYLNSAMAGFSEYENWAAAA